MRDCAICKHAHRVEIEAALFKASPDNAESDRQIRLPGYPVYEKKLQRTGWNILVR